jgi:hypothetical protein|tara:strand:- start:5703 stop:5909 length:207 start_codon:yes stop_codon:yes gene_type:complete
MKKNIIVASYSKDLGLVIQWLKLKKAIKRSGKIEKRGSVYAVEVISLHNKKQMQNLVKEKFGIFAKVI